MTPAPVGPRSNPDVQASGRWLCLRSSPARSRLCYWACPAPFRGYSAAAQAGWTPHCCFHSGSRSAQSNLWTCRRIGTAVSFKLACSLVSPFFHLATCLSARNTGAEAGNGSRPVCSGMGTRRDPGDRPTINPKPCMEVVDFSHRVCIIFAVLISNAGISPHTGRRTWGKREQHKHFSTI